MGGVTQARGSEEDKPADDFLPRKLDHPLSNSRGGGFSPSVVRLRVTRGLSSLAGDSMLSKIKTYTKQERRRGKQQDPGTAQTYGAGEKAREERHSKDLRGR